MFSARIGNTSLSLNILHNISGGAQESPSQKVSESLSGTEKQEIMNIVDSALGDLKEGTPRHEALKLAVQSNLDPVLNDPKKVLEMLNYAQEHGKSALTTLAISKRFATLIGDVNYFDELTRIERNFIKDKNTIVTADDEGVNEIKRTVQNRINTQIPQSA